MIYSSSAKSLGGSCGWEGGGGGGFAGGGGGEGRRFGGRSSVQRRSAFMKGLALFSLAGGT